MYHSTGYAFYTGYGVYTGYGCYTGYRTFKMELQKLSEEVPLAFRPSKLLIET